MIRIQNIISLFTKQAKDVTKNIPVLVLFIIYPCISLIMIQAMQKEVDMGTLFLSIFATMHSVFTPIVTTASIISEEKEKNTLRVLIMSNVTLKEYFFSIGGFVLTATVITGSFFLFMLEQTFGKSLLFLLFLSIGSVISIILGMCIGLYSKNTSAANGLAVPFGMLFAFMPMLSSFNKSIEMVSKFTYGQQISYLLEGEKATPLGIIILLINVVVFSLLAALLYRRSLSEE